MFAKRAAHSRGRRLARTTGLALVAALAVTGVEASAGDASAPAVSASVRKADRHLDYRERIAIRGRLASGTDGRTVQLQYAPAGGAYRTVNQTVTARGGRYAASLRPSRSGSVRAVADGASSTPARLAVKGRISGRSRREVRRGQRALVHGRIRPAVSGRRILIQISDGRGWDTVDRARSRRGGRFTAAFRPERAGRYRVRALFRGDRRNAPSTGRMRGRLAVYRPAGASWYGPGFYGNRTACGRTLGQGTLGVAHKTLPCGTEVTLAYRGRTVTVRVIDRGPFHPNRDYDLTGATKRALGFGSTGTVWATR